LLSTEEVRASAQALHQAGASEVYYRGKRAAWSFGSIDLNYQDLSFSL
jgi:hypothetical protein